MKEHRQSNKSRKRERHDSQMPRIRTLKSTKTHNHQPYKKENKWAMYYGSRAWANLRNEKLMDDPLCECCLLKGKITPATCVHHLKPFSKGVDDVEKWQLFLDENNLASLCSKCHTAIHNGTEPSTMEHMWLR